LGIFPRQISSTIGIEDEVVEMSAPCNDMEKKYRDKCEKEDENRYTNSDEEVIEDRCGRWTCQFKNDQKTPMRLCLMLNQ